MMYRNPSAPVLAIGLLAASLATADRVHAAPYTFPTFNQVVDNDAAISGLDPEARQLTGAPAGTYNAFTVSVSWSAISGDPYSLEAFWAFADTNDLNTAGVFYADPGSSPDGVSDGFARTLTWHGYMDASYTGGNPLYMHMAQEFNGSAANWNDATVTILDAPRYTTLFGGVTDTSAKWRRPNGLTTLSSFATDVPYCAIPFYVDTTSDYFIENLFPAADGYLFLYEDGFDPTAPLSNIVDYTDTDYAGYPDVDVWALTAGKQYYLVVTGYENVDFGAFSGSISSNDPMAPGQAFLGLVPEPASMILALASVGLFARRRARR